jgi:hypothetical protein
LIKDASFQVKNPFTRGTGYFCQECGQTFDSSLVNLRKKPKAVGSTIVSSNTNANAVFFSYVQEDKGVIDQDSHDEYTKYEPNRPSRLNSVIQCMSWLFGYLHLEILIRVILSWNNSKGKYNMFVGT